MTNASRFARVLSLGVLLLATVALPALAQTSTPTVMPPPPGFGSSDSGAWMYLSCTIDPGSLNLGGSEEDICIVPGLQEGDMVIAYVPPSLEAALVHSGTRVVSNNQVAIRITSLVNSTNGASRNWGILFFNRSQKMRTPGPAPTQTPTSTNTPTNTPTVTP